VLFRVLCVKVSPFGFHHRGHGEHRVGGTPLE
jgi:hypothetical protein